MCLFLPFTHPLSFTKSDVIRIYYHLEKFSLKKHFKLLSNVLILESYCNNEMSFTNRLSDNFICYFVHKHQLTAEENQNRISVAIDTIKRRIYIFEVPLSWVPIVL